jgi:hypothetical protein
MRRDSTFRSTQGNVEWIEVKYGSMSFLVGTYRAAGTGIAGEIAGFSANGMPPGDKYFG